MANAKKAWSKPVVARLSLSGEEVARLFPELGDEERRRFLDQAGKSSSLTGEA